MSRRELTADVCVVGAGAGGAVAAAELAEGGADVVVLEQGPEHDADTFTARPPQMISRLYREGGQTVTLGNPPIGLPLGRGIGGTTLVNSGTCFRTPPEVLDRWHREFGLEVDERTMRPHFERVEQALSVSQVTPELAGNNAAVARRGAERLGWSHGYMRRNAKGCVGSGVCAFGCPTSAKQHTGITYIPRARAAGARVLTDADVRKVLVRGGRAAGVQAGQVEVKAPTVIVAGGTINTPVLLARSGSVASRVSSGATCRYIRPRRLSRGWTRSSTWPAVCRRASTSTSSGTRESCSRELPGHPRMWRCHSRSAVCATRR